MSKISLVFVLLFFAFTFQVSINCNASAGENVLDFDEDMILEGEELSTEDPLCSSGNVCQIPCSKIINGCKSNIFFTGFWDVVPPQDLNEFGEAYLSECIFQRGEKSTSLETLKQMVSGSLQKLMVESSGAKKAVSSFISQCNDPNYPYSVILNGMLREGDPMLRALSRTYQLMMTVEKVCSKAPGFRSNVRTAINEIFAQDRNSFMQRFNNRAIVDKIMFMSNQIDLLLREVPSSLFNNYVTVRNELIERYVSYLIQNAGNPISPCNCLDLRRTTYSQGFQNLITNTLLSKCRQVC